MIQQVSGNVSAELVAELLAACEALLEDSPYASDAESCECGENGNGYDDDGKACCHILAHRVITKAKLIN